MGARREATLWARLGWSGEIATGVSSEVLACLAGGALHWKLSVTVREDLNFLVTGFTVTLGGNALVWRKKVLNKIRLLEQLEINGVGLQAGRTLGFLSLRGSHAEALEAR